MQERGNPNHAFAPFVHPLVPCSSQPLSSVSIAPFFYSPSLHSVPYAPYLPLAWHGWAGSEWKRTKRVNTNWKRRRLHPWSHMDRLLSTCLPSPMLSSSSKQKKSSGPALGHITAKLLPLPFFTTFFFLLTTLPCPYCVFCTWPCPFLSFLALSLPLPLPLGLPCIDRPQRWAMWPRTLNFVTHCLCQTVAFCASRQKNKQESFFFFWVLSLSPLLHLCIVIVVSVCYCFAAPSSVLALCYPQQQESRKTLLWIRKRYQPYPPIFFTLLPFSFCHFQTSSTWTSPFRYCRFCSLIPAHLVFCFALRCLVSAGLPFKVNPSIFFHHGFSLSVSALSSENCLHFFYVLHSEWTMDSDACGYSGLGSPLSKTRRGV